MIIKHPTHFITPQKPQAHGQIAPANTAAETGKVHTTKGAKKTANATSVKSEKPLLSSASSLFSAVSQAMGGSFDGENDGESSSEKREEEETKNSRLSKSDEGLMKNLNSMNHLFSNKGVIDKLQAMQQQMSSITKNSSTLASKSIERAKQVKDVFAGISEEFKAHGYAAIPPFSDVKLYIK